MDRLFTITEAKTHLSDILRHVDNQPAVIVRYSRPVGVIVSPSTLNALYEEIEELKDMLSIHEHDPNEPGVPLDKAMIELGWS